MAVQCKGGERLVGLGGGRREQPALKEEQGETAITRLGASKCPVAFENDAMWAVSPRPDERGVAVDEAAITAEAVEWSGQ